jgi:hypothetical protein
MSDTLFVILLAVLLPLGLYSSFWIGLRGRVYEMDWGSDRDRDRGSFFAPYALSRRFYYVIFGTALALALLCAYHRQSVPAVLLTASAIQALLFNIWTAVCYEAYLHAKYPRNPPPPFSPKNPPPQGAVYTGSSNYTAPKYAITLALAHSSVALFVLGLADTIRILLER